jgi:hypothetical protein
LSDIKTARQSEMRPADSKVEMSREEHTLDKELVYAPLIELCTGLAEATATGKVEWNAREDTSFLYEGSNGAVEIRSRDKDGEAPFELILYSPGMDRLDAVQSEWSMNEEPAPWNESLMELYRAARRRALGVDRVIEDLLAEVRSALGARVS